MAAIGTLWAVYISRVSTLVDRKCRFWAIFQISKSSVPKLCVFGISKISPSPFFERFKFPSDAIITSNSYIPMEGKGNGREREMEGKGKGKWKWKWKGKGKGKGKGNGKGTFRDWLISKARGNLTQ